MMKKAKQVSEWLATYSGRDMFMQLSFYLALFTYGIVRDIEPNKGVHEQGLDPFRLKFVEVFLLFFATESLPLYATVSYTIFNQFLITRLICRRFEDIPSIYALYSYWTESRLSSSSSLTENTEKSAKKNRRPKNTKPTVSSSDHFNF
jgi:hypothetical protein